MRPSLLAALRKIGHDKSVNYQNDNTDEILWLLDEKDQNSIDLTVKDYQTDPEGLSGRLHRPESADETYYIKGPMGMGLRVGYTGVHIAFCAGTGILVFLDLVSTLLIKAAFEQAGKPLPEGLADRIGPDFKLHLFVSFANRQETIGLDLCEKLNWMSPNFKLTVRFGEKQLIF